MPEINILYYCHWYGDSQMEYRIRLLTGDIVFDTMEGIYVVIEDVIIFMDIRTYRVHDKTHDKHSSPKYWYVNEAYLLSVVEVPGFIDGI